MTKYFGKKNKNFFLFLPDLIPDNFQNKNFHK